MNRRERKKEETRERIIDCALNFFKKKGFQQTSMEEIAEKADVSKGTLYNYFPDKESILVSYYQIIIADSSREKMDYLKENKDVVARLYDLMDFIHEIFKNDMGLAIIYLRHRLQMKFEHNPLDDPQRSGIEKLIAEIIKDAQKNGELRRDVPGIIIARNFMFLTMSLYISELYSNEPFEMEISKKQLVDIFLNGAKL